MNEFWAQLSASLFAPIRIVTAVSAAFLLGVMGPFGTFVGLTFVERLMYWTSVVVVSLIFVQLIKVIIELRLAHLSYWTKALIVAATLTVFLGPVLPLMTDLMIGGKGTAVSPYWLYSVLVFGITLLVFLIRYLLGARSMQDRPRLFDRFENPKVKHVTRVTVRDHYVDVYTDLGIETLLMRFSDAIAELEGQHGRQVHRSHWISYEAVSDLKKKNGRMFLTLIDGSEVPVSRSYQDGCLAEFQRIRRKQVA